MLLSPHHFRIFFGIPRNISTYHHLHLIEDINYQLTINRSSIALFVSVQNGLKPLPGYGITHQLVRPEEVPPKFFKKIHPEGGNPPPSNPKIETVFKWAFDKFSDTKKKWIEFNYMTGEELEPGWDDDSEDEDDSNLHGEWETSEDEDENEDDHEDGSVLGESADASDEDLEGLPDLVDFNAV